MRPERKNSLIKSSTLASPKPAPVEYRQLRRIIVEHGLLEPQTGYYVMKTVIALATLAFAIAAALLLTQTWALLTVAVLMGFASTQIALLGHDVGHRQAFRGRRTNRIARLLFGGVLLGISHTWWNDKHNQHHATPNHVDKDPDVQFPFLAFSPAQIASRHRLLRPVIAVQAFVFVAVLPFQAVNMRWVSIKHLFSGSARQPVLQGSMMMVHFLLYGLLLWQLGGWGIAIAFFLVHQATFGVYNSSVFASNHKGMAMIEEGGRLDFLREQVLTSRNVTGHPMIDFWYGGLNYQIEHHLFPTMPRNNLRKAQVLVEDFCKRQGIPYYATGIFAAYREGLAHLHETGASLRGS